MGKVILIIFSLIGLVVMSQSLYIVNQVEQSVELRFGEAVDLETEPGLKFKLPFVDEVKFFDNRLLDLNAEPKEVIASDQKRLIVDAFAKYRINNALLFFQTARNQRVATGKLNSILESSIRQVLGSVPLKALLQAGERTAIMKRILDIMNEESKGFGVDVVDVRIMRADLPDENSDAIFRRMQTERQREAKEFRAEGEEEAQKIRAKADREKIEILAEAKKSSEIIRGGADAKATKIFAKSFGRDVEFYEFYRSLEAYKTSLAKDDTNILLSPNNRFFKHFGKLNSAR